MEMETAAEKPDDLLLKAGNAMRITCQCIGLAIVLIGLYYALNMFFRAARIVNDPALLKEPLAKVEELIDAHLLEVNIGNKPVPFGKVSAMAILGIWFLICVWIPLSAVYVGGRIVAWNFDERRHIRMVLKEFLARTGSDVQPGQHKADQS